MLNDEESSKLALSEAAKKVSDLKARQWEISKNAVVILAFLAAVFHGDLKYALFANVKRLEVSRPELLFCLLLLNFLAGNFQYE